MPPRPRLRSFVALFPTVLALAGAGCGFGRSRAADYRRPFAIVTAAYLPPAAVGVVEPGFIDGWDHSVRLERWVGGWTHRPVRRDGDGGIVNYVLHPLSGSETHLVARNNGWTFWESALFDLFGSVYWEYVFENLFERPSRTDLLATGPLGAVAGELRWQGKQAGIAPGLLDPFGAAYAPGNPVAGPELGLERNAILLTVFQVGF